MSALDASLESPDGTTKNWFKYTRGEQIADGALHLLGLTVGILACVMLLLAGGPRSLLVTATIGLDAFGLLAMLTCSALYNLARGGAAKAVLRRLDHAAIFAMIAGTYTPICILGVGGLWGWCLLAAVWAGALVGGVLKIVAPGRFERASIVAYILLGWAGLAAIGPLVASLPAQLIVLIAAGGVCYTLGVLMHLAIRLRYHHAVWHACVLAGAASHFVVLYDLAAGLSP